MRFNSCLLAILSTGFLACAPEASDAPEKTTAPDDATSCTDLDGDGFGALCDAGPDCDDEDDLEHTVQSLYVDADGDGSTAAGPISVCAGEGVPDGYAETAGDLDCDDSDPARYRLLVGWTDSDGDGFGTGEGAAICSGEDLADGFAAIDGDCDDTDDTLWGEILGYTDLDGDGVGIGTIGPVCAGNVLPDGFAPVDGDCDDDDDTRWEDLPGYVDGDGDGLGTGALLPICSGAGLPAGHAASDGDCDDGDANLQSDLPGYVDGDGDGVGTGALQLVCSGAALPATHATTAGDCDDGDANVWTERSGYLDTDGDGLGIEPSLQVCSGAALPPTHSTANGDCDDNDSSVWQAFPGYIDGDADGFGTGALLLVCSGAALPANHATAAGDCDDSDANAWTERSGYLDTDGDGLGDGPSLQVCAGVALPPTHSPGNGDCDDNDPNVWQEIPGYYDGDADGFGTGALLLVCSGVALPSSYSSGDGDCDDGDANAWTERPGYLDTDGDGLGTGALTLVCSGPMLPATYANIDGDCDDNDAGAWDELPGYLDGDGDGLGIGPLLQVCSGAALPADHATLDGDCDDNDVNQWQQLIGYVDGDGDGLGLDPAIPVCSGNTLPIGFSALGGDCDDGDPAAGQSLPGYFDGDGDGLGAGPVVLVCTGATLPVDHAPTNGDCDDNDASVWQELIGFQDGDLDGVGAGSPLPVCSGNSLPALFSDAAYDCDDNDVDNIISCLTCVDGDGDGSWVGCDQYVSRSGPDCDDLNGGMWDELTGYIDLDNDTYTVGAGQVLCTDGTLPVGFAATQNAEDCDDNHGALHTYGSAYADVDDDGYSVGGGITLCLGELAPTGYTLTQTADDCNDGDPAVYQDLTGFVDRDDDAWTVGAGVAACSGANLPVGFQAAASASDDCNDLDPEIFPNAAEVAGDLTDNDCDGTDDQASDGTGVFVSATTGNDLDPGTLLQPVATVAQGISLAQGQGLTSVYIATGAYPESVTTTVDLFGGFSTDFGSQDLTNLTAITAPGTAAAVTVPAGDTATLTGLSISTFAPTATSAVDNAGTLTLRLATVDGGFGAGDRSAVFNTGSALVADSTIASTTSTDANAWGLRSAGDAAVFNSAIDGIDGDAGGYAIVGDLSLVLDTVSIANGNSGTGSSHGVQAAGDLSVSNCDIRPGSGAVAAIGIYTTATATATVADNVIGGGLGGNAYSILNDGVLTSRNNTLYDGHYTYFNTGTAWSHLDDLNGEMHNDAWGLFNTGMMAVSAVTIWNRPALQSVGIENDGTLIVGDSDIDAGAPYFDGQATAFGIRNNAGATLNAHRNIIDGGGEPDGPESAGVWNNGSAILHDNTVYGGQTGGTSRGIHVDALGAMVAERNDIDGGTGEFSTGVYVDNSGPVVLRDCDIHGGAAERISTGIDAIGTQLTLIGGTIYGGVANENLAFGVRMRSPMNADIRDVQIDGGMSDSNVYGVHLGPLVTASVVDSVITGGASADYSSRGVFSQGTLALTGSTVYGGDGYEATAGVYIETGTASIDSCVIDGGTSVDNYVDGIHIYSATAQVHNNFIYGGESTGGDATGIFLSAYVDLAVVVNNTIHAGDAPTPRESGSNGIWYNGAISFDVINLYLTNNIIDPGTSTGESTGIYAYDGNDRGGLRLDNNIIWGAAMTRVAHDDYDAVDLTMAELNGCQFAMCNTASGNLETDPGLVDLAGGNYHLTPGSAAIDAGVSAVPGVLVPDTDIDAEARPNGGGIDIGADEWF